ncbi:hypothetical protein ACTA71_011269 [Dictyostelium dimigraforme]
MNNMDFFSYDEHDEILQHHSDAENNKHESEDDFDSNYKSDEEEINQIKSMISVYCGSLRENTLQMSYLDINKHRTIETSSIVSLYSLNNIVYGLDISKESYGDVFTSWIQIIVSMHTNDILKKKLSAVEEKDDEDSSSSDNDN